VVTGKNAYVKEKTGTVSKIYTEIIILIIAGSYAGFVMQLPVSIFYR